jgi:hypothetical protein
MTTLVFRSSNSGNLEQIQVGAADIVATLNAAQSAWGWVGGLTGIQRLISGLKETVRQDPFKTLRLNPQAALAASRCHILTGNGMFYFEDHDGHKAFGGDPITQAIGLTICALAYECGGEMAVDLFVKFVAEHYIHGPNKIPGLPESLYQQLMDNISVILNEGATRGLHERFEAAAADLPEPAKQWQYYPEVSESQPTRLQNFEFSLVGGLLDWLTGIAIKSKDPYYTRSSLAVRTAAYLKAVGYDIGPIVTWNGKSPVIKPEPRGVVLVLGGTSETDFCQTSDIRIPNSVAAGAANMKLHFYCDTAGSMLLNALGIRTSIRVERVQTMFENVRDQIRAGLKCKWDAPESPKQCLTATFTPNRNGVRSKPLSLRIASLYFPLAADLLAACYESVSTETLLESVQKHKFQMFDRVSTSEFQDLAIFRIITASIVICIAESLSTSFHSSRHVTQMYLGSSLWLDEMCGYLDKHLASGIDFADAAIIAATIHAAAPSRAIDMEQTNRTFILGFRNGPMVVLPSLLVSMVPTEEGIGISCLDKFIANIPVFTDGSIRGTTNIGPNWAPPNRQNPPDFSWQTPQMPDHKAPDLSLYLGLERPILSREPVLVFGSRIGGSIVGYSSIGTAMWVIARSLRLSQQCPSHQKRRLAIKLDASHWALSGQNWAEKLDGPLTKSHCIFLPAGGSAALALHFAGQCSSRVGISYGCFDCAAVGEPSGTFSPFIVVGYGPLPERKAAQLALDN